MSKQTGIAVSIAIKAHEGQTRWDKKTPYISHPAAIAGKLLEDGWGNFYVATAWLHDVLEDTEVTAKDLLDQGVEPVIVDTVILLSKTEGQSYLNYILDVQQDHIARVVKIEDIKHNMSDLKSGSMRDKYSLALYILEGVCHE